MFKIKKISIWFTICCLVLLSALPSAFATSGGLLDGKSLNVGTDHNTIYTTSSSATDRSDSSSISVGGELTNYDVVWYEFPTPVSIGSYHFYGTASTSKYLRFYDSNGIVVRELTSVANNQVSNTAIMPVGNVKKVAIYNYTSAGYGLYEFDVFPTNDYSGGLLDGKVMSKSTIGPLGSEAGSVPLVTDNDETTSVTESSNFWYTYTFPYPVQLTGYRSRLSNNQLVIKAFDSNDVQIGSALPLNSSGSLQPLSITNVKKISVQNNLGGSSTIHEFNVYGQSLQDVTPPSNVNSVQYQSTVDSISMDWVNPSDSDFSKVLIYDGLNNQIGEVIKPNHSYVRSGLTPSTQYSFKLVSVDSSGNKSAGYSFSTYTLAPDLTPPAEVTSIQTTIYDDQVKMTWVNPPDSDFIEVRIFKNGVLHAVATTPATQFTDYDLTPNTTYSYLLRSRDTSGNMSSGVRTDVTTTGAPDIPSFLNGTSKQDVATLSWEDVSSSDYNFVGYNIYQDGVKINTTPITEVVHQISGLTFGQTYKFKVSSIDDLGNESAFTQEVSIIPAELVAPKITNLRAKEVKKNYIKFSWDPDPNAEKYVGTVTIKKLKVEAMGFSFATATEPTETTTNFETTQNELLVDNLGPGDTATITVSAYNTEFGEQPPETISGTTSILDAPEFNSTPSFTPRDLFDSAMSLAANFWPFLLLGLSFVLVPWIYSLVKKSATTAKGSGETEESRRSEGRELNREIRVQLRKGEKSNG